MNTYSSKAAAKKGAKRANLDIDVLNFLQNAEGRWYWEELHIVGEYSYCPNCGINLDNGYSTNDDLIASNLPGCKEFEYVCSCCNTEFGPKLVVEAPSTSIKIEKERPEQNGIVRPSIGGKCRAIWEACDDFHAFSGRSPSPKEIKAIAAEEGWNQNNAVIEMYQWRKFHGIASAKK